MIEALAIGAIGWAIAHTLIVATNHALQPPNPWTRLVTIPTLLLTAVLAVYGILWWVR